MPHVAETRILALIKEPIARPVEREPARWWPIFAAPHESESGPLGDLPALTGIERCRPAG
jgi:hypothetical protein